LALLAQAAELSWANMIPIKITIVTAITGARISCTLGLRDDRTRSLRLDAIAAAEDPLRVELALSRKDRGPRNEAAATAAED